MYKLFLTLVLLFSSRLANAEDTLKFLVGFAPGGGQYIVANILSTAAKSQGINNHILFKEGAGGIIGMNECVTSANKNTLCLATQAQYVHSVLVNETIRKFNPEELTYVKLIGLSPSVLVTNTANSRPLSEVIRDIKMNKVSFGSGALGLSVFTNWILKQIEPKDAVVVNYNGTGPVLNNIIGKQIEYAIMPYAVAKNAHTNGQVRIVASLGESVELSRLGIPLLQSVVPNIIDDYTIFGIIMAPNISDDQVKQHESMLTQLLALPQVKEQLLDQGIFPVSNKLKNYSFGEIAKMERARVSKLLEAMPKR